MADVTDRRVVVVDGSNLATEGRTVPSLRQLDEAVRAYAEEDPEAEIVVVVDASFEHRIDPSERPELVEAELHGDVVSPPAGAIGRGDAFVLRIAERTGARVLSNDSFQEFHAEHPWLFDEGRLIGGKPVSGIGWIFTPRIPVRGPKSRAATGKAKRSADRALSPPLKAAELARAAKKVAARKPPSKMPGGAPPRVGDVWPAVGNGPKGEPHAEAVATAPPPVAGPGPAPVVEALGAPEEPGRKGKRRRAKKVDQVGAGAGAVVAADQGAVGAGGGEAPPSAAEAPGGERAKKAVAKKAVAKKAAAKKTVAKKAVAKEAVAKKAVAKKAVAKKAAQVPARKAAATKVAAKKVAVKEPVPRTSAAEEAGGPGPEEREVAQGAALPETPAKRARGRKAVTEGVAAAAEGPDAPVIPIREAAAAPAAGTDGARTATAKKSAARKAAAKKAAPNTAASRPVEPGVADLAAGDGAGAQATAARNRASNDPALRAAIDQAMAEVLAPAPAAPPPATEAKKPKSDGKGKRRRRRTSAPPPAVNEPLAFITFVASFPLLSEVDGEVVSFTSHGAMVDVDLPQGGVLHCYIPLGAMGDPPPSKARQVLSRGERRSFVLVGLDPPRRVAELALPGVPAGFPAGTASR